MISASLALPLSRLARTPRAWIPIVAWATFALGAARVVHRASASGATDALGSTFGGLALPLLAYAVVGAVLGGDGLARSIRSLVAFGASPPRVALGTIGAAMLVTAASSAVLGAAIAAIAHGVGDPPLARDVFTSAWIAGVGGTAYASLFAFGASVGKRGGGRAWALAGDWILGGGSGIAGLVTPRAHLRSLLGGDAVATLSGRASTLALVVLALAFGALAVARCRRA